MDLLFSFLFLLVITSSETDLVKSASTDQMGLINHQRLHPNPKHFKSIRPQDPIPPSIAALSDDSDTDKFIIHHISDASNSTLRLLILVQSSKDGHVWRATLRRTLSLPPSAGLVFAVPVKGGDARALEGLRRESQTHQDMILYLQVDPSSAKSAQFVHYAHWLHKIYNFHFLLRTHDRYYIRTQRVLEILSPFDPGVPLYMGYFRGNLTVDNDSDSSWFLCPMYAPHALEGGYIVSRSLMSRFLKQSKFLSYYNNEGGSIGLWSSPFRDVVLVHSVDFNTGAVSRGCWNSVAITPVTSEEEMEVLYRRSASGEPCCIKEFETESSYMYNWTSLPSQCCQQQVSLIDN